MILSVASGKGGTGKTTIAVALASYMSEIQEREIHILDCDVEEPNANLFLKTSISVKENVYVPIPEVNMDRCNGCGKCDHLCEYSAIVMVKKKPLVFPDMCHSCGGCMLICPVDAITEVQKEIGIVEEGYIENLRYVGGRTNISQAISPPLIKAVRKHVVSGDLTVIDAPPGTSCPVIESVIGSDYVLLVTEPTPFGLNDLKLAVGMIQEIGLSGGVLINKDGIGDNEVESYCIENKISIVGRIPHDREIAEHYAAGDIVTYLLANYRDVFESILDHADLSHLAYGGK